VTLIADTSGLPHLWHGGETVTCGLDMAIHSPEQTPFLASAELNAYRRNPKELINSTSILGIWDLGFGIS
jgi:hypothetical protein